MISFLNLSSAVLWKWIRKKFDLILSYTVSTQNQFMTRKNMNLTRLISQNKDDRLLNLEYFFLAVDKKAKSVKNESPFGQRPRRGRWPMLSHMQKFFLLLLLLLLLRTPPPPNSATFCQILPNSTRIHQNLPNSTRFCQILPNSAKFCQNLSISANFFQILPISA